MPDWLMPAHGSGVWGATDAGEGGGGVDVREGGAGEGGGATCVMQCSVTTRVGVEHAGGVYLQDEANDVGVSLLAAAHEGCETLCVGDGECRSYRVQQLWSEDA